jgi:hypothetical protein
MHRRWHFVPIFSESFFLSLIVCDLAVAQPSSFTPLPAGVRLDAVGEEIDLGSMPLTTAGTGKEP